MDDLREAPYICGFRQGIRDAHALMNKTVVLPNTWTQQDKEDYRRGWEEGNMSGEFE